MLDSRLLLQGMTSKPGIYRMLDKHGDVLYVGKAKNLKKRVASYFTLADQSAKTRAMVAQIRDVEVIITQTEKQALILENNQIKQLKPRYNVWFRDSKSYPYLYLSTTHAFPRLRYHRGSRKLPGRYFGPYPNGGAVRDTVNLMQQLFMIRQCSDSFFANRQRPCLEYQIKRCSAPCVGYVSEPAYNKDVEHAVMFLQGDGGQVLSKLIKPMQEASDSQQYEQAARYRDQIRQLRKLTESQSITVEQGNVDVVAACVKEGAACVLVSSIRNGLSQGSHTYFPSNSSAAYSFHKAIDQAAEPIVIEAFLVQFYLQDEWPDSRIPKEIVLSHELSSRESLQEAISAKAKYQVKLKQNVRSNRAKWVKMAVENAELGVTHYLNSRKNQQQRLTQLTEFLHLNQTIHRIECFDISHTAGEATVAACVVFDDGYAVKTDYRSYNISGVKGGDDYAAMGQAIMRRYVRINKQQGKLPDLIIVDGGKGQVAMARKILNELDLGELLLIGIAKGPDRKAGLETLIIEREHAQTHLPHDSPALHLLQQIRDEAHRFAVVGHRKRRGNARKRSPLEEIDGVGRKRRQHLLTHFGGLQGIISAGIDDLSKVNSISPNLAHKIYDNLHSL